MDAATFSLLSLSFYIAIAIALPILLWIVAKILSPSNPNPVKNSPYECSQVAEGEAHIRLPIRYYPYAMIYAIFGAFAIFLLILAPEILKFRAGLDLFFVTLVVVTVALMSAAVSLKSIWRRSVES